MGLQTKYRHPALVAAAASIEQIDSLFPAKRKGRKTAQYNPKNAIRYRPYFDRLLEKPDEALLIPASHNNVLPATLQIQLNEALKWLVDQPKPEFDKYRVLRLALGTRKVADGIVLQIKNSHRAVEPVRANLTESTGLMKESWKARLFGFIESATIRPAELHIADVLLTDNDMTFVENLLAQLGPGSKIVYQGKDLYVTLS